MRSAFRLAALVLILSAAAGCGGGDGGTGSRPERGETIDRATFVDVYVDLRRAAFEDAGGDGVTPEQRERVLDAHGVSEEDLLDFARTHGRDTRFMVEVWTEVEERLEALDEEGRPLPSDTSPGATPDPTGGPPRP